MDATPYTPSATRSARIRRELFGDLKHYPVSDRGFIPLPIILRCAQFLFSARAWQVYTYIALRTGPHGVAWFPIREMAWDLGFTSLPKLKLYVDRLIDDGWIAHRPLKKQEYYFLVDPRYVLSRMLNKLPEERVKAISELQLLLGQDALTGGSEAADDELKF